MLRKMYCGIPQNVLNLSRDFFKGGYRKRAKKKKKRDKYNKQRDKLFIAQTHQVQISEFLKAGRQNHVSKVDNLVVLHVS